MIASKKSHKKEKPMDGPARRAMEKRELEREERLRLMQAQVKAGKAVRADRSKWRSYGRLLFATPPDDSQHPIFYQEIEFICKDCGKPQVWTARQQKWWHEVMGGDIETTAVRCRGCRRKERTRREEANRIREEGLARKRQA